MSEAAPKKRRGEALREHVLEQALALFSERGYFNTSIHDIRRAAGVSIGAIYHHFHNKETLAQSLYDKLLEDIDAALKEAAGQHSACREKAAAITTMLFDLAETKPQSMQFVLLAKHREYLPEAPPICSSGPFGFMRSVIEDGMRSGEVRKMEPWVAASAMFGGALRMMNLRLDGVLAEPLARHLDAVVDCGWRAIEA